MAKKHRPHDEEAWMNAKKICRLNARQLEMAQRLGMNPKKLPRLRPGPQEHWKAPVGKFIEDLYRKRFEGDPRDRPSHAADLGSSRPVTPYRDADAQLQPSDAMSQVDNLVCYFTNLADDLDKWRAHGSIDRDLMQQISAELREIAGAIDTGAVVSQVPEIPVPPRRPGPAKSRHKGREVTCHDDIPYDDIPF
jgi:hypothetical protein